ncbi:MAG: hypothetical protein COB15_06665 [Flavobacteriales bacterium]|nr:MAG: hypothetical protein COB15_06665 [Flavobacteriales bacterium]
MKSKIEKLQELQELFKSEAISKEEFETLKKEILEDKSIPKEKVEAKKEPQQLEKEEKKKGKKVILKGFYNSKNSRVEAPKIVYLDFDDISDEEIKLLKPFIKKKYSDAPSEMTPDEISIGDKLFSFGEIDRINAKRGGFNYAFESIFSLVLACFALFIMLFLPCLILLGGVGGTIAAIVMALMVVNKSDATQLDRNFSYAALVIVAVCIFLYVKDPFNGPLLDSTESSWFSSGSSDENSEVAELLDCSQSVGYYEEGYASGKMVLTLGGSRNCETYVEKVNYESGRNIMVASDCFCAGFDEAIHRKEERYAEALNEAESQPKNRPAEEQGYDKGDGAPSGPSDEELEQYQLMSDEEVDYSVDNLIVGPKYSSYKGPIDQKEIDVKGIDSVYIETYMHKQHGGEARIYSDKMIWNHESSNLSDSSEKKIHKIDVKQYSKILLEFSWDYEYSCDGYMKVIKKI